MYNYKVEQIRVALDFTEKSLKNKIARTLQIFPNEIISVKILRKSLDARKQPPVNVISAEIETLNPVGARRAVPENNVNTDETSTAQKQYKQDGHGTPCPYKKTSPVIIGFGPAGIAAAYVLAKAGLKPIVFERGEEISARKIKVDKFWNNSILDENSNVLFGEGGAGLFSDGKLTSRSKDIENRNMFLEMLVRHGADRSILTDTKAHIGTDKLRKIIKSIREEITELGGEIRFNSTLTGLKIKNGKLCGIYINGSDSAIETQNLILAIGHSARETVQMLEKHLTIEAKPFAIGVRVEFEQEMINRLQYGKSAINLPAASFNLTYQPKYQEHQGACGRFTPSPFGVRSPLKPFARKFTPENEIIANGTNQIIAADTVRRATTRPIHSCYTFCMCPGGQVISCSAKNGTLSTNGMSYADRSMKFGNAAFLVPVNAAELPFSELEKIEKAVFERGGVDYSLPAQNLASFLYDKENIDFGFSPHRYKLCDISGILPNFVEKTLKTAIPKMLNSLHHDTFHGKIDFSRAAIFAAETGSSSPVRIVRNQETLQSVSLKGLFPCGEGAGYAGGIVSSGIDGIKCAKQLLR